MPRKNRLLITPEAIVADIRRRVDLITQSLVRIRHTPKEKAGLHVARRVLQVLQHDIEHDLASPVAKWNAAVDHVIEAQLHSLAEATTELSDYVLNETE